MGFWPFLNFIYTNINGGCQHDTGSVLGVGGYPSSQMWEMLQMFRVMSKIHLSRFWPN